MRRLCSWKQRESIKSERAEVVRLIVERAQQLVPGAAKRALNDQTTLAAPRAKNARSEAANMRREVTPAAPVPGNPQAHDGRHKEPRSQLEATRDCRPKDASITASCATIRSPISTTPTPRHSSG